MIVPRADRDRVATRPEVHRPDRSRRLGVADSGSVAVAELAREVVAPAAHRAVVENRATAVTAGGDRHRRAARAEVDRADRARRLVVADPLRVAVAELAEGAVAPAAHRVVVEQRAAVGGAGADRHRGAARPEADRADRARRLVVADVVEIAVAEPAVPAVAPAAHRAVVEDRAGVVMGGADCDRGAARAEVDRADRARRLVVANVSRVSVAELARESGAPAAHRAVIEDRAGVEVGGADRHGRAARAKVHRADRARRLVVADRGGVAVAELAVLAVTPAAQGAVVENRAGVVAPGRDRHRGATSAEVDRADRGRSLVIADRGGVAVAETAAVPPAPAAHRAVGEDRAAVGAAGVDPSCEGGAWLRRGLTQRDIRDQFGQAGRRGQKRQRQCDPRKPPRTDSGPPKIHAQTISGTSPAV